MSNLIDDLCSARTALLDNDDWCEREVFRVMYPNQFTRLYTAGKVSLDGRDERGLRIRLDLGFGGPVPLALDWVASLPLDQRPQRPG